VAEKKKKRKRVTVQVLKRKHQGKVTEPYRIMEQLIASEHGDLKGTKIVIAWRIGWRIDANGHLRLGQCRKRGDLDRELDSFDFVILLNKEAWPGMNDSQKVALIDHELCHAQVVVDADGEPKKDDRGRFVCRIRKHDIEEFRDIVDRHGLYTDDLAAIAQAAVNDANRPLLNDKKDEVEDGDDSWRKLAIAELKLPLGQHNIICEKCTNLGQLSDLMAEKGDWWPKEFKRIQRAKVDDAWAAFWKRWGKKKKS